MGVIGVAVFRERVDRPEPLLREQSGAAADAAGPATESARSLGKLGTGHGRRRDSAASYTTFERTSEEPESVIRIYYDSRRNLVAQGILPGERYARSVRDPFPGGFVPDPR